MKRYLCNVSGVIWGSLLVLTLAQAASAQESGGAEERLVRSVYAKLMVYNKAAESERATQKKRPFNPDEVLQVELRGFETGLIEKIYAKKFGEFVTVPVGETLQVHRERTQLPNGPEHVTYKVRWEESPHIMEDWSTRPVVEMLSGDEQLRASVRKYTSYEVRVRLQGREKIYRATAFFLEPLQSTSNPKPMIFDMIMGIEEMTDLVEENRMPLISPWEQYVKTPLFERYKMAVEKGGSDYTRQHVECPDGYDYMMGGSDYFWEGWCCNRASMHCCLPDSSAGEISCCMQTYSMPKDQVGKSLSYCGFDPEPPIGNPIGDPIVGGRCVDRRITFSPVVDTTGDIQEDHLYGYHKAWAQFQGYCQYNSDCTVNCRMEDYGNQPAGTRETGMRIWYIHKVAVDSKNQPSDGVQITTTDGYSNAMITCGRAYAAAWRFCLLPPCGVRIKIEWNGTGFTTDTEESMKWALMPTQSCMLQAPVAY